MPDVDGIEALWCKIMIGKFAIYVGTMYRPPGACYDAIHVLNEYMQRHLHDSKKIILTGDYNPAGLAMGIPSKWNCRESQCRGAT